MKIDVFFISLSDVEDALVGKDSIYIEELLKQAMQVTELGGRVVIMRKYSNARPDIIDVFITTQEIKDWKTSLLKHQTKAA